MDLNSYKPVGKINNMHMLTLKDYNKEEIFEILSLAIKLKSLQKKGKKHEYLKGQTLAMIFSKPSTRTRVSFEQGIKQLGGSPIFLNANDIQLGKSETISDTVKVLQRFNIDAIMIRTFKQSDVEELATSGNIPIINGLTDDFHPCQVLADALTIYEHFGKLKDIKLTYFGDGNNMSNSLMILGAKLNMNICICCPKGHEPNMELYEQLKKSGANVSVTDNIEDGIKDCNVLYTDVFFSMGQEKDEKKTKALMPYQITKELLDKASSDAVFMHCLPAHRGEEVSSEIIDGSRSIVFEQAENRLHAQKAIMTLLMKK